MRSLLSGVLTLVAMAAIVLAVPSVWVTERLVDQDGFVSTVTPMARNADVQDYLAKEIAAQVTSRTQLPALEAVVEPMARTYTHGPDFDDDFVEVVSQQHAWLFNEPEPGSDPRVMQLDITPMVKRVIAASGQQVSIDGPIRVPLTNESSGLEAGRYHEVSQQITRLGRGAAAIAIVAAVLALLIGRRRGTIFAWLGIGTLLAGAFTWAVDQFFARRAKQEVDGAEESGRHVAELIIDQVSRDLTQVAVIVGAVGLGMVVIGGFAQLVLGPRR